MKYIYELGFSGGTSGKELTCQCRRPKRCGFDPWVRKMPWRRAWQPTPVFLPEKSHGQRSLAGYSSTGWQRVGNDKQLSTAQHIYMNYDIIIYNNILPGPRNHANCFAYIMFMYPSPSYMN